MKAPSLVVILCLLPGVPMLAGPSGAQPTLADAKAFLERTNTELLELANTGNRASWVEETYITPDTEALAATESAALIARTTAVVHEAERFDGLSMPADMKRQ